MQAVLNAALPIFGLILTGFVCGRIRLLGRSATHSLNRFAIFLALPALLFLAMTRITPDQFNESGFALAFGGGIALTFGFAFAWSRKRCRSLASASIEGLDAAYANVGFMGIPLCLLAFGESSMPAAVIATLLTACVLFLFSVVLIETDLQKGASLWRTLPKVLRSLLRSPLLLAPAAGLAIGLAGFGLPAAFERFVSVLAGAASPCALVCIGLFLAQEKASGGDARTVGAIVALKLVFQPAVTALLAFHVFEMPKVSAQAAVLLSALPIGSGPFTLAKLYRLEAGVTSGAILVSHLVSVLTVSSLVAWFS
jgi:predicted permease